MNAFEFTIRDKRWCPQRERWCATIGVNGKGFALGRFVDKADAIAARIAGEDRYHGEFAARHGSQKMP